MRYNKLFFLAFMMLLPFSANAQYVINGHVDDIPDGYMKLHLGQGREDSTKVTNGCFTFKGSYLEAPEYVMMRHTNYNWGCAFWLGNDTVDFTTVNDMPVVKGSKTEDEYKEFRRTLQPVWDSCMELKKQMDKDVSKYDSLMQIVNTTYKAAEDSAFADFVRRYPSSQVALNNIFNMRGMDKVPYSKYSKFLAMLTPGAFKGRQWKEMCEYAEKDLALEPGHLFPEFAMDDVYGKRISTADFKGKYVLLTLSNYGVKDYDADLQRRKMLYEKYHSKGLEMIDYSLSRDLVNVIKAPANMGLRWHFVTDYKSFDCPWLKEHAIDHITQNFLIAPDGMIIGRNLFGEELETEINNIFY